MRDAADDVGEEAVKRAVAQSASQKPYSPSPGAGSLRTTVPETCSPVRRCTPSIGMERLQRRRSEGRRKIVGAGGSWVEVCFSAAASARIYRNKPIRSKRPTIRVGYLISYVFNLDSKQIKPKTAKGGHIPARLWARFYRTIHVV